jgi:large subunit ribosomal protein L16
MKQFPNNLKYKKYHKINDSFLTLVDKKNFYLIKGQFGIQAVESGKLTFKHIESCRRTIKRGLKKQGEIYIRIFTSIPVTKKPIAVRMGKGKGGISY